MDESMALIAIENNKHLLILIQHKAALAYFCAYNKNLTLFSALRDYCMIEDEFSESDFSQSSESEKSDWIISKKKLKPTMSPIQSDESESF